MKRKVYIEYEVKAKQVSAKSRAKPKEVITFYTLLYYLCDLYDLYAILLILSPSSRKYVRVLISYLDGTTHLGLLWTGLASPRYLL